MDALDKVSTVFALVILFTVMGLHIYSAVHETFSVPNSLDELLLLVAGGLFLPKALRQGKNSDSGSR